MQVRNSYSIFSGTQMLAIRLKGIGKKHQRSFRVVIQETRSKLLGKFIEDLGWYNPHTNKVELNKERIQHWIGVGARPSMTMVQIMKKARMPVPVGIKSSKTYAVKAKAEAPVAAAPKA